MVSAAAMRASSGVNLSSRWNASSTSFLPASFLRYFSAQKSAWQGYINEKMHTGSSLTDFLCHDAKDRDDLNHNLNNDIHHGRGRPEMYIFFKPHEKGFHSAKQVDESILVSADILDSLWDIWIGKMPGVVQGTCLLGEECRFR
jgi:hypothetical protein